MADQDDRTADPPQRISDGSYVAGERVKAVLGCDHVVSFGLNDRDQLAEARAISPQPVDKNNAGFGLFGQWRAPLGLMVSPLRCPCRDTLCPSGGPPRDNRAIVALLFRLKKTL